MAFGFHTVSSTIFSTAAQVKAPMVYTKGKTLGHLLFNFRSSLLWRRHSRSPRCSCKHFPLAVQAKPRPTGHITTFAAECSTEDIAHAHMQDEVRPPWDVFFTHNTTHFQFFLERWKLPSNLIIYWQHFLRCSWEQSLQSTQPCWTMGQVRRLRRQLQHHVISPADHFPHTLTVHCAIQWHQLLCKTFLDAQVFRQCSQQAIQVLKNMKMDTPSWTTSDYGWGRNFDGTLSKGYILPKPSRDFAKARPIVDYTTAGPRKLGMALAVAILEIMKITYGHILDFKDVHEALRGVSNNYFDQVSFKKHKMIWNKMTLQDFTIKWHMIAFFMQLSLLFIDTAFYKRSLWIRRYK